MADQITKIIIRRGTDVQRRTANVTGITFDQGEPAYCTDTKRLFVGDGAVVGGTAVGVRNLGPVAQLFGPDIQGYTNEAYNVLTLQGAEVGDIIYDKTTRNIYSLTAKSNFPPLTSDFTKYDSLTLINNSQFEYDTSLVLNIREQGVSRTNINSNIADGLGLVKALPTDPISLSPGGIANGVSVSNLQFIAGNSLYLNTEGSTVAPKVVQVNPRQLIGRTSTSTLSTINYSTLASELISTGLIQGDNGIRVDVTDDTAVLSLSASIFNITPSSATINVPLSITGNTNVVGNTIATGYLSAGSNIFARGSITSFGTIYSYGDVIAYYTSDRSLKTNINKIDQPLIKLKTLNGYEFDWKDNAPEHLRGHDIGVIANEVEDTLPEAVINRPDGVKAVNYNKIVPLLIESIKELTNKVEQLESKIL
jgi:hypothetical protein